MAINFPFNTRNFVQRHCNKILATIWISGSVYALYGIKDFKTIPFTPPRLYNSSEYPLENTTWYVCSRDDKPGIDYKTYITVNFVATLAVPLIVMSVCYFLIVRKLISQQHSENDAPLRRSGRQNDTSLVRSVYY